MGRLQSETVGTFLLATASCSEFLLIMIKLQFGRGGGKRRRLGFGSGKAAFFVENRKGRGGRSSGFLGGGAGVRNGNDERKERAVRGPEAEAAQTARMAAQGGSFSYFFLFVFAIIGD
jgi:hypothetical protein